MRFDTDEIGTAVGGRVDGPPRTVDGVSIDSRAIRPGDLFVALVAERDGHDFLDAARAAGSTVHLVSDESIPVPDGGTLVRVDDTARALTALGARARDRLPDRVVGVTGSVGKTSVKDLLRAAGATTWSTWANPGSFNNELGVPLTLANAPGGTELTVVEMGARGRRHIADLCRTARPTVGIVTAVADAHLELFGSIEEVAGAKGELVEALPSDGRAILNAEDPLVVAMASRTAAEVVTYGIHAGEVRAEDVALDASLRPRFRLVSPWGSVDVQLAVAGAHQVPNALAAASAVLSMGAGVDAVAAGLAEAALSAHRMAISTVASGLRIVDDAYNANPTSMLAALDALAALPAEHRIAVLGTMAELGPDAPAAHRRITAAALERGIDVIAVDEPAYGDEGVLAVPAVEDAADRLASLEAPGATAVLVKASRSAGLERVVELLSGDAEPSSPTGSGF